MQTHHVKFPISMQTYNAVLTTKNTNIFLDYHRQNSPIYKFSFNS